MIWKMGIIALLVVISIAQSHGFSENRFGPNEENIDVRKRLPFPRRAVCPTCACGVPNSEKRIIGGTEAKENQYPWIAQLVFNGTYFYCGASLINDQYLLTAAHCTRGVDQSKVTIRLLSHSRVDVSKTAIIRKPAQVIEHPDYEPSTYNNDIALVKLNQKVEFTPVIRPICLPKTTTDTFAGQQGISMGWGGINAYGTLATELREVTMPVITNDECIEKDFLVSLNMMCAGGEPNVEKDSCQGDSGGPFIHKNGNKFQQIGIVSWGDGCGEEGLPGVYTRVSNYFDWIKSNTRDACYCS